MPSAVDGAKGEVIAAIGTLKPDKDDKSYVLASCLIGGNIKTMKDIWRILDTNKAITWKRPLRKDGKEDTRRVLVHAGEWLAFIKANAGQSSGVPFEEVDAYIQGIEEAKAAARAEKIGRN